MWNVLTRLSLFQRSQLNSETFHQSPLPSTKGNIYIYIYYFSSDTIPVPQDIQDSIIKFTTTKAYIQQPQDKTTVVRLVTLFARRGVLFNSVSQI